MSECARSARRPHRERLSGIEHLKPIDRPNVRELAYIGRFAAPGSDALYEGIPTLDWSEVLDPGKTLAVRASCRSSALTHSQFIAQRTKDAIVDQLRERLGARPSVDLDDPDVLVFVHLVRDEA